MRTFVRLVVTARNVRSARLTNLDSHYLEQALDTSERLPFLPSRILAVESKFSESLRITKYVLADSTC